MKYICNRCKKEFKQKIDYTRHTNRKKPCHKIAQKSYTKSTKSAQKYECEWCNKIYVRKYTLDRHIERFCKVLKDIKENVQENVQVEEGDNYDIKDNQEVCVVVSTDVNRKTTLSESETTLSESETTLSESEIELSKSEKIECAYCGKSISAKRNIRRHMKTCKSKPQYELNKLFDEKFKEKEIKFKQELEEKDKILQEHTEQIRKKNQELLELKEVEEEYFNFMKKMAEKSRNNITYNDHKSVNMFFIMRNYKDAKNFETLMNPALTEGEIKKIKESTVRVGVYDLLHDRCIEGVDVEDRPFHCVDDSRNKYLLYTSNDWKVDKNANKIITEVINKVREVYDTEINIETSKEETEKNYKNIIDLLDLEKKGRKILLKELNKKTLIKNTY